MVANGATADIISRHDNGSNVKLTPAGSACTAQAGARESARAQSANPGAQPSNCIAMHSPCVEFAPQAPSHLPDKSSAAGQLPCNVAGGENTTGTKYSPAISL